MNEQMILDFINEHYGHCLEEEIHLKNRDIILKGYKHLIILEPNFMNPEVYHTRKFTNYRDHPTCLKTVTTLDQLNTYLHKHLF